MSMSPVIGMAVAPAAVAAQNLLLWTEEFDNAAWVVSGVTVTPDAAADPDGAVTAESCASTAVNDSVAQTTQVVASSGAAVTEQHLLTGAWTRVYVSGSFGGPAYVFSVYLKGGDVGANCAIRMDRSGGFLRCSMIDFEGGMTWLASKAQLEVGSTPTAYKRRTV